MLSTRSSVKNLQSCFDVCYIAVKIDFPQKLSITNEWLSYRTQRNEINDKHTHTLIDFVSLQRSKKQRNALKCLHFAHNNLFIPSIYWLIDVLRTSAYSTQFGAIYIRAQHIRNTNETSNRLPFILSQKLGAPFALDEKRFAHIRISNNQQLVRSNKRCLIFHRICFSLGANCLSVQWVGQIV